MSVLVYKQRFVNPNFKTTASKNYAHVRYIATRPRVAKNPGMNHGLFGKLAPGRVDAFKDWRDVARLVYRNSRQHITMYRSVVSFDEKTAAELMLADQKAWQRYIENHIMTIAEKNHIKREHLQWACALHQEKNHPHIHIVFWDTSARVRNPYTHPSIPDAIRRQMIKDTFAEKIRAYGEQKDQALRGMRQISDELVEEFDRYMRRLDGRPNIRKRAEQKLEQELVGLWPDLDEHLLDEAANRIFQIRESLGHKGRIAYQYLRPETKQQVDELVAYLLEHVPALREQAADYMNSKMGMVHLYGGKDDELNKMRDKFANESNKVIANRILGIVKRINRLESEQLAMTWSQNHRKMLTEQMILEALDMLAGMVDASERQLEAWGRQNGAELSKDAKKEWYLKLQDKGYEH